VDKYIVDTSAILHNHRVIEELRNGIILIPLEVLKELDSHKYDGGVVGVNARAFARLIDGLASSGDLSAGAMLPNGSTIKVVQGTTIKSTADDAILALADKDDPPIVVTDDIYLRILASGKGLKSLSCDAVFGDTQIYSGVRHVDILQSELDKIYDEKKAYIDNPVPNEYVIFKSEQSRCAYGRYNSGLGYVTLLNGSPKLQAQVQPKNLYQKFLVDAILDPKINIVMAHSLAGCGKTIISLAAALYMVRTKRMYHQLVISKSIAAVGGDRLGYLPGSLDEKMKYWVLNYSDNLSLLQQDDIFASDDINVCTTMHMRGRSINGSIIIIDEFQNFTPSEAKTIITRIGDGSKIICLGDITQIDNPSLNIYNNGLTYIVNRFKGYELAAVISLEENERSAISKLAARIL